MMIRVERSYIRREVLVVGRTATMSLSHQEKSKLETKLSFNHIII